MGVRTKGFMLALKFIYVIKRVWFLYSATFILSEVESILNFRNKKIRHTLLWWIALFIDEFKSYNNTPAGEYFNSRIINISLGQNIDQRSGCIDDFQKLINFKTF